MTSAGRLLLFLITLTLGSDVMGQTEPRYLVLLKDKANSPFSLQKPTDFLSQRSVQRRVNQNIALTEHDLPVNPSYVTRIKQTGAKVLFTSRWFNAIVVEASDNQLAAIVSLPFYKGLERNLPLANRNSTPTPGLSRTANTEGKLENKSAIDHGRMTNQLALLGIPAFHATGFQGQNKLVAVVDAGFPRANELTFFETLFKENRVKDTYDFVARNKEVFDDHFHGLHVLSTLAAYEPGLLIGAAYKADFALYRAENATSESPYEEVTWLLAAERADSLGADIISSSLGYNTFSGEFDQPSYNYTYQDMNGFTTIISRAARFASRKGILVVNSAGNSGNDAWKFITAPADVDSVLVVGSVALSLQRSSFSSIGPTANGVQKPDVAAVGSGTVIGSTTGTGNVTTGNGTSYAAPQIAGFAAILWQKYPFLTAMQLADVIRHSGNQANTPDNLLGYGVPYLPTAEEIIATQYPVTGNEDAFWNQIRLFPNPTKDDVFIKLPDRNLAAYTQVRLISSAGITLWQNSNKTDVIVTIPVAKLSGGIYFVQVTTGSHSKTMKFVKL
jgi:serine protease AprX